MKIADLLKIRDRTVIVIGLNESVQVAIQKLVENNIGALPVCDANRSIMGIVSERDLLKVCSQDSKDIGSTKVKDVMTKDIVISVPEDDLDDIRSVMTQKGIRHLPVMVGPKLQSIISMRDIVEAQLEDSKATVRFLSDYMSGGYL